MDPELKKQAIEKARDHFGKIVAEQIDRVEKMKQGEDWLDYGQLKPIVIGVVGGDGIGPIICDEAHRILKYLLADEIKQGKVELRVIEGLTKYFYPEASNTVVFVLMVLVLLVKPSGLTGRTI